VTVTIAIVAVALIIAIVVIAYVRRPRATTPSTAVRLHCCPSSSPVHSFSSPDTHALDSRTQFSSFPSFGSSAHKVFEDLPLRLFLRFLLDQVLDLQGYGAAPPSM